MDGEIFRMQLRKIILFSVLILSVNKLRAADGNPFLSKSESPNPFLNDEHSKSVCDNCKKLQDMLDCEKANRKNGFSVEWLRQ